MKMALSVKSISLVLVCGLSLYLFGLEIYRIQRVS